MHRISFVCLRRLPAPPLLPLLHCSSTYESVDEACRIVYSCTAARIQAAACSISAAVVCQLRLRRNAAAARVASRPIARRTADGSAWPAWQAEPVEHATSARMVASRAAALTPGKLILRVFGKRATGCPFTTAAGSLL